MRCREDQGNPLALSSRSRRSFYSHLKNLRDTPAQTTAIPAITAAGSAMFPAGSPMEADFSSLIP